MSQISNYILPCAICSILVFGLIKKVNVFDEFLTGAKDGMITCVKILPAIIALMTAVGMFSASGGLDVFSYALTPIAKLLNIPVEVMPLAILRPVSGSGSLVIFQDILQKYGPDSFIGRVASVMQGSSETTFYVIAVYYGAAGIKHIRHTIPAALCGDIAVCAASALTVGILMAG